MTEPNVKLKAGRLSAASPLFGVRYRSLGPDGKICERTISEAEWESIANQSPMSYSLQRYPSREVAVAEFLSHFPKNFEACGTCFCRRAAPLPRRIVDAIAGYPAKFAHQIKQAALLFLGRIHHFIMVHIARKPSSPNAPSSATAATKRPD